MTLKETLEYAAKTVKAKKEIGKLAESDEMIVLLFNEVEKQKEKIVQLQEEIIHYAEQEAGSSL